MFQWLKSLFTPSPLLEKLPSSQDFTAAFGADVPIGTFVEVEVTPTEWRMTRPVSGNVVTMARPAKRPFSYWCGSV